MFLRVCYDNGNDYREFDYFSKYKRINAKGIKEEIESEMFKRYRKKYKICYVWRIER